MESGKWTNICLQLQMLKQNFCRPSKVGGIKQGPFNWSGGSEDKEITDMKDFKDINYIVIIVTDIYWIFLMYQLLS